MDAGTLKTPLETKDKGYALRSAERDPSDRNPQRFVLYLSMSWRAARFAFELPQVNSGSTAIFNNTVDDDLAPPRGAIAEDYSQGVTASDTPESVAGSAHTKPKVTLGLALLAEKNHRATDI
jgi:hypothetical protein